MCQVLCKFYLIRFPEPFKEVRRLGNLPREQDSWRWIQPWPQHPFCRTYTRHHGLGPPKADSVAISHWGTDSRTSRFMLKNKCQWKLENTRLRRGERLGEERRVCAFCHSNYRKSAVCSLSHKSTKASLGLSKESVPICLLENKLISAKTSFQDK